MSATDAQTFKSARDALTASRGLPLHSSGVELYNVEISLIDGDGATRHDMTSVTFGEVAQYLHGVEYETAILRVTKNER